MFDSNVNEGAGEATRILQVALGVGVDGDWGPQTQGAVDAITNVENVIQLFTARRQVVYRETSGYQYFGTDWIRRATEIGNEALAMATGTPPPVKLSRPGGFKYVPRARFFLPDRSAA